MRHSALERLGLCRRAENLASVGRKFVLQGGTHKNLAVVKAQVDFIRSKVPDAEIVVHPYSGEAGAIGVALCALDRWERGATTRFRGFDVIAALTYRATTSLETVCTWCPVHCQRTFIDVEIPGAPGRPWSTVSLPEGWVRLVTNNACPKGLVEDVNEMRAVKVEMEQQKDAYPNVADMVRRHAIQPAGPSKDRSAIRVGLPKVLNIWSTHQFWIGFLTALGIKPRNIVFSEDTSEAQFRTFGKGRRHSGELLSSQVYQWALWRVGLWPEEKTRRAAEPHDLLTALLFAWACGGHPGLSPGDGGTREY